MTGTAAEVTPIRAIDDHRDRRPARSRSRSRRRTSTPCAAAASAGASWLESRRAPRATQRRDRARASRPVPLSGPYLDEREEELVLEVLRSGRLSLGPTIDRFEELFAERSARRTRRRSRAAPRGCTCSASAPGSAPGDEVITSPYSFAASANCFLYEGATPVFADVDPRTLNLDPAAVEAAITPRTKAIVAVDIFGYPCELDELRAIARAARARADRRLVRGARRRVQGRAARLARHARRLRVLPEQADHDRRGRRRHDPLRGGVAAARSLRNQGRADAGGWLEHVRLGYNYRLDDVARRDRDRAAREARPDPRAARRGRGDATTSCSRASTASSSRCADDADHERSWFVYVVSSLTRDRRERVIAPSSASRSASTATCRRSTSSRTCASATASARGCAPWRRTRARARSRCRSSPASSARRPGARRRGARRALCNDRAPVVGSRARAHARLGNCRAGGGRRRCVRDDSRTAPTRRSTAATARARGISGSTRPAGRASSRSRGTARASPVRRGRGTGRAAGPGRAEGSTGRHAVRPEQRCDRAATGPAGPPARRVDQGRSRNAGAAGRDGANGQRRQRPERPERRTNGVNGQNGAQRQNGADGMSGGQGRRSRRRPAPGSAGPQVRPAQSVRQARRATPEPPEPPAPRSRGGAGSRGSHRAPQARRVRQVRTERKARSGRATRSR